MKAIAIIAGFIAGIIILATVFALILIEAFAMVQDVPRIGKPLMLKSNASTTNRTTRNCFDNDVSN